MSEGVLLAKLRLIYPILWFTISLFFSIIRPLFNIGELSNIDDGYEESPVVSLGDVGVLFVVELVGKALHQVQLLDHLALRQFNVCHHFRETQLSLK